MNVTVTDNIYKEFWMIYVEGKSSPVKKHSNYASAYDEALRLCAGNIGRPVYILRTTGALVQEIAPVKFIKLD